MTVVYVDTLFLLNLAVDYLLLRLSARICGQYVLVFRLMVAAALDAVYALCAFLPIARFLTLPPMKAGAGVIFLALVAFGGRKRLLRLTVVFFACACALGGGVLMISLLGYQGLTYSNGIPATGLDFKVLCLSAAGSYLVLSVGIRCLGRHGRISREVLPVTLFLEGRSVRLDALVDTGNTLSDPLSSARVMVVEWEAVSGLFPKSAAVEVALRVPLEGIELLAPLLGPQRLRLIPYRAVGVGKEECCWHSVWIGRSLAVKRKKEYWWRFIRESWRKVETIPHSLMRNNREEREYEAYNHLNGS